MGKTIKGEKHFTSSVWIVTKNNPKKVLLVLHKKFNKWIQPGGHIEPFENPVETAIREVKEETGIDVSFLSKEIRVIDKDGKFLPLPKFLMEERIPKYKDVPMHFHLDFHYVVKINEQKVHHKISESDSIGWFTKQQALKFPMHEDSKVIIKKLLSPTK